MNEPETLTDEQLQGLQLEGIRKRFHELRNSVDALKRRAADAGVDDIECLADVVPLLFPHTVFKSYPSTWIDNGRFDLLTRWLGSLTEIDLTRVNCEGIATLDDWIGELDRCTELRLVHTFGTSGKLSFVPHTRIGWQIGGRIVAHCIRDWHGRGSGPDLLRQRLPLIYPGYRHGASSIQRGVASAVELFAGSDENCLFLYPDARWSADVASLAGRLRAAELRGESDSVVLTPRLREQHRMSAERERDRQRHLEWFLHEMVQRYRGQDVYLLGVWPVLYDWAKAGMQAGLRRVFGPGTVLHTGGGMKGRELHPGWREEIYEFIGVDRHHEFYAMSELTAGCVRCPEGHYHVPPVIVPMLLDPETGALLPRSDGMRGRFAAFDLLARHAWGGVVSGDEVTLSGYEVPCPCGRGGAYVEPDIRRYSTAEGGTDKISCAAAGDAYESAIAYLADTSASPR